MIVPFLRQFVFEAREVTLKTLLQEADIITLHLPLTKETFHLISKEEFALMKESAVLINTSRGAVIEEKELIKALKTKRIFAAGLMFMKMS